MNPIAGKTIKKFPLPRLAKVLNFKGFESAKADLRDNSTSFKPDDTIDIYDPSHKVYVEIMNLLSFFSDKIVDDDLFEDYADELTNIHERYIPSYPPMSPITHSYANLHCFFDFTFGKKKETLGSIFTSLLNATKPDKLLLEALEVMNNSHLSFYLCIGAKDDKTILEEILTGHQYTCIIPSGYSGEIGAILLCRIVPALHPAYDYHIVINTPYLIFGFYQQDWVDYFTRRGIHSTKPGYEKVYKNFMKHNPYHNFWHEYIMDAYSNFRPDCILLTGIPDKPSSLPHSLDQ